MNKSFSLQEAVEYAKRLMENDLWVFQMHDDSYNVIRLVDGDATFNHYCQHGTPVANIKLKHEVMYTMLGVIPTERKD